MKINDIKLGEEYYAATGTSYWGTGVTGKVIAIEDDDRPSYVNFGGEWFNALIAKWDVDVFGSHPLPKRRHVIIEQTYGETAREELRGKTRRTVWAVQYVRMTGAEWAAEQAERKRIAEKRIEIREAHVTAQREANDRLNATLIERGYIEAPLYKIVEGKTASIPVEVLDRLLAHVTFVETSRDFPVDAGRDVDDVVHINLTDEGVIADLIVKDEVVGTWGATAQELLDDHIRRSDAS